MGPVGHGEAACLQLLDVHGQQVGRGQGGLGPEAPSFHQTQAVALQEDLGPGRARDEQGWGGSQAPSRASRCMGAPHLDLPSNSKCPLAPGLGGPGSAARRHRMNTDPPESRALLAAEMLVPEAHRGTPTQVRLSAGQRQGPEGRSPKSDRALASGRASGLLSAEDTREPSR